MIQVEVYFWNGLKTTNQGSRGILFRFSVPPQEEANHSQSFRVKNEQLEPKNGGG